MSSSVDNPELVSILGVTRVTEGAGGEQDHVCRHGNANFKEGYEVCSLPLAKPLSRSPDERQGPEATPRRYAAL